MSFRFEREPEEGITVRSSLCGSLFLFLCLINHKYLSRKNKSQNFVWKIQNFQLRLILQAINLTFTRLYVFSDKNN